MVASQLVKLPPAKEHAGKKAVTIAGRVVGDTLSANKTMARDFGRHALFSRVLFAGRHFTSWEATSLAALFKSNCVF